MYLPSLNRYCLALILLLTSERLSCLCFNDRVYFSSNLLLSRIFAAIKYYSCTETCSHVSSLQKYLHIRMSVNVCLFLCTLLRWFWLSSIKLCHYIIAFGTQHSNILNASYKWYRLFFTMKLEKMNSDRAYCSDRNTARYVKKSPRFIRLKGNRIMWNSFILGNLTELNIHSKRDHIEFISESILFYFSL